MADTDRELLELAARAAGINWRNWTPTMFSGETELRDWPYEWNPLTDDGDALRLAAKLVLRVDPFNCQGESGARAQHIDAPFTEYTSGNGGDHMAAVRRAIVRAAAHLGRTGAGAA